MERAIEVALSAGYRHIDTAFNYNNEEAIGNAICKWLMSNHGKRDQLFVTTKLPHIGMRASDVSYYLQKSLQRLQLDYVDLYLVHLPFGFIPDENQDTPKLTAEGGPLIDWHTDHIAIWKAMEEQVKMGKTKAIGLSNFNPCQIQRILDCAHIKPAVLQVEMHALHQQHALREFCATVQLPIVAYSPLGSPTAQAHFLQKYGHDSSQSPSSQQTTAPLENLAVNSIAKAYHKTPGQILLRYLVQQSIAVIPKSCNPDRIRDNIQVFDFQLSELEMDQLAHLDMMDRGRIFNFLFFKGVEKHPEYPFPDVGQ